MSVTASSVSAAKTATEVTADIAVSEFSDDDVKEFLGFLQVSSEPWGKVEAYWKNTSKERFSEVGTISEYFSKYPPLKSPLGYALVR